MIDWNEVIGFEWDAGNARKNADKHDVSQAEAEQMFFNEPLLTVADQKHSGVEARIHTLGHTDDGRLLHATFTLRRDGAAMGKTRLRIISARDMSRRERSHYER